MKKFYKVAAIVTGTAFCLAFILGLAGFCTGGTVSAAEKLVPGNLAHFDFPFFWFGDDDRDEDWDDAEEYEDEDNDDRYDDDDWYDDDWYDEDDDDAYTGNDAGAYSYENTYTDKIKELEWNIGYGEVTVKTGDSFSIKGKNLYKNGFESRVKDGVWYIDCDIKKHGTGVKWNWKDGFDFSYTENATLVITVPKGTVFDEASIKLGVGEAELSDMSFKEADIDVGVGNAVLNKLVIKEDGEISVGTGEVTMKEFTARDLSLDCGVGTLKGDGTVTGESEFTCGIGSIKLDLSGREKDYNYELTCGLGSIKLGDDSYSGVTDKEIRNGAKNSIDMDCGIGSISVKFK